MGKPKSLSVGIPGNGTGMVKIRRSIGFQRFPHSVSIIQSNFTDNTGRILPNKEFPFIINRNTGYSLNVIVSIGIIHTTYIPHVYHITQNFINRIN